MNATKLQANSKNYKEKLNKFKMVRSVMTIVKKDSEELRIKSKDTTDVPFRHARNAMAHKDH